MEVVFILKDGTEKTAEFSENQTLYAVAERNGVRLDSFCDGSGVCGGCHVIIENLNDKLPKISDLEEDALDKSKGVTMKSRLACQIVLNSSLDGLRARIV
jgi:ferredoxin